MERTFYFALAKEFLNVWAQKKERNGHLIMRDIKDCKKCVDGACCLLH